MKNKKNLLSIKQTMSGFLKGGGGGKGGRVVLKRTVFRCSH